MASDPRTILFMPESAYGPTNNCVGIAARLTTRGHRVVFAAERSWAGQLDRFGFVEDLVDLAEPAPTATQDAGSFWKEFIARTAPEFRKPTIDQLETWIKPVWEELVAGAKFCQPQLEAIIARHRPDVIVEDNVVTFPALTTAGVPYVRIVSCNPLEVPGAAVPPAFSGYPIDDDSRWTEFRAAYDAAHRTLWQDFDAWVRAQGAQPLPDLEFIGEGDLNLYVYPEVADYTPQRPLGPTWHRLDSAVRETDDAFEIPAVLRDRPAGSALVYFSLGSLGSADVALMQRVIDGLASTPHRYVVSLGPLHAELSLPPTMWGAEYVPQTAVLPLVDLVITHGGNNTVTESLHFGRPMICLPLFWDQYDNAQRLDELGLGRRLDTYRFTDAELHRALDDLLRDDALSRRLVAIGSEIRGHDGLGRAADLIEAAG
jgi:MGT family glycosyltransferase